MDLRDLPSIPRTPKEREADARAVRDILVRQGRIARQYGFRLEDCPPFMDEDMAINWRNGWRWQDEEMSPRDETHLDNDHRTGGSDG